MNVQLKDFVSSPVASIKIHIFEIGLAGDRKKSRKQVNQVDWGLIVNASRLNARAHHQEWNSATSFVRVTFALAKRIVVTDFLEAQLIV